jgi:hypothetical protein
MRGMLGFLSYRVIKYNSFAVKLANITTRTIPSYANLILLMFLTITVYAFLGMELFANKFDSLSEEGQQHCFDDPGKAWMTVFDVSTTDDWYSLFELGVHHSSKWLTIIFVFSTIYFVNFMIFGLVLAIILDGFSKFIHDQDEELESQFNNVYFEN